MMSPFDFVNAINNTKQDLIRDSENPDLAETFYKPFIINRAFSHFKDTIMYANEINMYPNIANKLQNDYYLNSIRKGKRYSKWHKKEEDDKIEAIMEYYNVNYAKAREIGNVLTDEHLTLIKIKLIKGGNNVQSQSTGGG
jgi:hypothetical protein